MMAAPIGFPVVEFCQLDRVLSVQGKSASDFPKPEKKSYSAVRQFQFAPQFLGLHSSLTHTFSAPSSSSRAKESIDTPFKQQRQLSFSTQSKKYTPLDNFSGTKTF
jgi:hypothetical protein